MEKRNPITEELINAGSTLGNFPAVNPYAVPMGYFDEFPSLMYRLASGHDLDASLSGLKSPFSVPGGYFDTLPGILLQKVRETELRETGEEEDTFSPLLAGISKSMPFSVPDNYFESLAGKISNELEEAGVNAENLSGELLAARLNTTYTVPGGYFEQFPAQVLKNLPKEEGRVIKGSFGRNWTKYAAAALITGVMITAGFFVINRNTADQQVVSATGLQQKTAQTSDEEILNYLESVPASAFDVQPASVDDIPDDAIVDLLANVSDEELQQYVLTQSDTKQKFN